MSTLPRLPDLENFYSYCKLLTSLAKAFVLVMTEVGQEATALDEARKLSTVTEADRVFGAYDMIVRIDTNSDNEVGETVRKLRNKEGIRHTVTLNCVEP